MERIEKAVSILMHDGLVVYPTETLYGLGADAFSD
jgi:L-threonylcarbamoyladenylate synthase